MIAIARRRCPGFEREFSVFFKVLPVHYGEYACVCITGVVVSKENAICERCRIEKFASGDWVV